MGAFLFLFGLLWLFFAPTAISNFLPSHGYDQNRVFALEAIFATVTAVGGGLWAYGGTPKRDKQESPPS